MVRNQLTIAFAKVSLLAIICRIAACSSTGTTGDTQERVRKVAAAQFGNAFNIIPNTDNSFVLCVKMEKEIPPVRPVRFFVYDSRRDTITYERVLENGSVEWLNATQLSIKTIPGNITGDEDPKRFSETYDVLTGTISFR